MSKVENMSSTWQDARVLRRCASGFDWNTWNDNEYLYFGDDKDVTVMYNGTKLAIASTITTSGYTGRTLEVDFTTNVACGAYANAFKALTDCSTSGRATGLLSAGNFEMILPASDVSGLSGTYAPLEMELNCAASNVPSWRTSFAYMGTGGDSTAITAFQAAGNLFIMHGLGTASSATNLFHTTGSVSGTHGLRIMIDDVAYDIMLKASTYA